MTARVQDLLARLNSLLADGGPYQVDTVRPEPARPDRSGIALEFGFIAVALLLAFMVAPAAAWFVRSL